MSQSELQDNINKTEQTEAQEQASQTEEAEAAESAEQLASDNSENAAEQPQQKAEFEVITAAPAEEATEPAKPSRPSVKFRWNPEQDKKKLRLIFVMLGFVLLLSADIVFSSVVRNAPKQDNRKTNSVESTDDKKETAKKQRPKRHYEGEYPQFGWSQALIDEAVRLAWPEGTPSGTYAWNGGGPTKEFQDALDAVYPGRGSWGTASKLGCSCDVFVGTVVRSCGLDPDFPRGLSEQFKYEAANCTRSEYHNVAPASVSEDGDIVLFDYSGNGAHIVIRGNGYYYEAGYQVTYGHTNTSLSRLQQSFPWVVVLRPNRTLSEGDTGPEVEKLQKYLVWYFGEDELNVTGVYDMDTINALASFQEEEMDMEMGSGILDEDTIIAMRQVVR